VLQDAGVAELLGLNASDVVFSGYSAGVLFELITFLIFFNFKINYFILLK
jgi:hypothetical protein